MKYSMILLQLLLLSGLNLNAQAPPLNPESVIRYVEVAHSATMEQMLSHRGSYVCSALFNPGTYELPVGYGNTVDEARALTGMICIRRRCDLLVKEMPNKMNELLENPQKIIEIWEMQGLSDRAIKERISKLLELRAKGHSFEVSQTCLNNFNVASGIFVMCFNSGMTCGAAN